MLIGPDGSPVVMPPRPPSHPSHPSSPRPTTASDVSKAKTALHNQLGGKSPNDAAALEAALRAIEKRNAEITRAALARAAILLQVEEDEAQRTKAHQSGKPSVDVVTEAQSQIAMTHQFDDKTLGTAAKSLTDGPLVTNKSATPNTKPVTVKQAASAIQAGLNGGLTLEEAVNATRAQFGGTTRDEVTLDEASLAVTGNRSSAKGRAKLTDAEKTIDGQKIFSRSVEQAANKAMSVDVKPSSTLDGAAKTAGASWHMLQKDRASKADANTIAKDEQAYDSALASEYNAAAGKTGSDTSWSDDLLQIDRSWQADQTVTRLNAGSGADAPSAGDVQTSLKAMRILDDAKTASGASLQNPGDPLAAAKSLTQSLQGVPQNSALYKEVMGGSDTQAAALKSVLGSHGKTPQDTLIDEGQTLSKYRGTVLFDALSKAARSNPVTLANLKNVGTPGKLKDIANLLNAVNEASPELAVALYQHNLQGKVDSLIKHGDPNAFASPSGETLDQMDDYFGPLGSIVDALGGPKSAAAQPVVNAMQKQFTTQQGFLDRDKKAGVIPGPNTWDSTLCYARSNHAPLAVYQELIDRNRGTSLATSLEGQTGLKPTPVRKTILPDNAQTLSTAQAALTSALGSKAATRESMTKAFAAARKTQPTISNATWSKAAVIVQAQSDGTQWQQDNATKIKAGTAKAPSDPIATAGKKVASYDLFDADTLTPSVTVLKNGTVALARNGKPSGSNASNTAGSTSASDYLRGLISQGMSMPEAIGLTRVMMGGSSSNDGEVMQAALTVGGEQNLSTYYAHPDNPKNDPIQLAARQLQAYKLFDSAALKSLAHRMTKNVSTAKGDRKAMQGAITRANADYTKWQHAAAAAKKDHGSNTKLQQAAAIALQTYHKDLTDALNAAAGQPSSSKWQTNPDDVDLLWKANYTVPTAAAQPYLDKAAGTGENSPEAKAYYAEVNRWTASLNAQQVIAQTLAVDSGPSGNLTAATTLSEQLAGLSPNDPLYQEVMGDASITNLRDTALKEITDAAAPPTVCYSNPTQGTPTARLKAEGTRLQAYSNTVFYGQLLDGALNDPNTKALFSTIGADVRSQSKPGDKLNTLARYMTATSPDLANALYEKEFGGTGKHDQVVQWAKQANNLTPLAAIYSGGGGPFSPAMTNLRYDVEAMLKTPLSQGGFGTSDVNSDLNDTSHREGREYFQSGQAFGFDHIKAKGQFAQDIIGDLGNSDVGNEIQREIGAKDTGKPLAAVDPTSAASRLMKSGPDDQPWQGGMAFTKDGNVGGLAWQNDIHDDTTRDQVLNDVGNAMTGGKVTNTPTTLAQKQALDDGNFALYDPNKVVYNHGGRKTTLGDIVNSLIASEGINQVGELSPVTVGALSMQWWASRDAQGSAQQLGLMDGIGADGRMLYVGPADTTARYGFNDWEKHSGLDKGLLMAQPDIVLDGKGNALTGSAYMSTYKPNQSWWERNGAYVDMGLMVVASAITIAVQPETAALWAGILSDAADAYLAYTAIKGTAQSIDALGTNNGYRNGWNWLGLAANALGGLAGVGGVADRTAAILSRTAVMDRTMPNLLRVAKLMPRGAGELRPYELTPRSLALNTALFGTPQAAERTMAIIRALSKIAGKGGARATLAVATSEEDLSRLARLAQHFKAMGPMGYIGLGAMGTNLVSMGHQGYQLIQAGDQASAQDWLQFVTSAGLMGAGFGVSGARKASAKSKATASSPFSSPYDKGLGKQAVSDDAVAPNTSGPVLPADAIVVPPYAADKGFGGAKSAQDATYVTAAHPDDGQTSSAASDQTDSTSNVLPQSAEPPNALSSPETLADVAQAAVVLNSISATAAQLPGTPAGGAPGLSSGGASGKAQGQTTNGVQNARNAADQPQTFTPEDVADAVQKVGSTFGDLIAPTRRPYAPQVALVTSAQFALMRDTISGGRPVADDETVGGFAVVNGTVRVNGGKASVIVPERIEAADASSSSPLVHDVLHTAQSPVFTRWANSLSQRLLSDSGVRANGWRAVDLKEGLTELFNVYLNGSRAMPGETPSFAEHVVRSYQEGYASVLYPVDGAASEQIVAQVGPDIAARVLFRPDPEAQAAFEKAAFDVFRDTPPSLVAVRYFVEAHTESSGHAEEAGEGGPLEIVYAKGNRNKKGSGLGPGGEYRKIRYKQGSYSIDGQTYSAGQRQGKTQSGAPNGQAPVRKTSGEATPEAQGTPATAATPPATATATGTGVAPATTTVQAMHDGQSGQHGKNEQSAIDETNPAGNVSSTDEVPLKVTPYHHGSYIHSSNAGSPETAQWKNPPSVFAKGNGDDHVVIGSHAWPTARSLYLVGAMRELSDTYVYAVLVPRGKAGEPCVVGATGVRAQGVLRADATEIDWQTGHPMQVVDPRSRDEEFGVAPDGFEHAFVFSRCSPAELDKGRSIVAGHWYNEYEDLPLPRGAQFEDRQHADLRNPDKGTRFQALGIPKLIWTRFDNVRSKGDSGAYAAKAIHFNVGQRDIPLVDPHAGRSNPNDAHSHFTTFAKPRSAGAEAIVKRLRQGPQPRQFKNADPDPHDKPGLRSVLMSLPYTTRMTNGNWGGGYTGFGVTEINSSAHGDLQLLKSLVEMPAQSRKFFIATVCGTESAAYGRIKLFGQALTTKQYLATLMVMHPEIDYLHNGEVNPDSKEEMTALRGLPFREQLHDVYYGQRGMSGQQQAFLDILAGSREAGVPLALHADKHFIERGKDGRPIRSPSAGQRHFYIAKMLMTAGPYDLRALPWDDPDFVLSDADLRQLQSDPTRYQRPLDIIWAHGFGLSNWGEQPPQHWDDVETLVNHPLLPRLRGDSSWAPVIADVIGSPESFNRVISLIERGYLAYGSDVVNPQTWLQATAPWHQQQQLIRALNERKPGMLNYYAGGLLTEIIERNKPAQAWFRYRMALGDDPIVQQVIANMPDERREALSNWVADYERAHPGVRPEGPPPDDVGMGHDPSSPPLTLPASARPPQRREVIHVTMRTAIGDRPKPSEVAKAYNYNKTAHFVASNYGVEEPEQPVGGEPPTPSASPDGTQGASASAGAEPAASEPSEQQPATGRKIPAPPKFIADFINSLRSDNITEISDDEIARLWSLPAASRNQLEAMSQWLTDMGGEGFGEEAIDVGTAAAQRGTATLGQQLTAMINVDFVAKRQADNNAHLKAASHKRNVRTAVTVGASVVGMTAAGAATLHEVDATHASWLAPAVGATALLWRATSSALKVASTTINRKSTEVGNEEGIYSRGLYNFMRWRLNRTVPKSPLTPERLDGPAGINAVLGEAEATVTLGKLLPVNIAGGEDGYTRQMHLAGAMANLTASMDQALGASWGSVADETSSATRTGAAMSVITAAAYGSSVMTSVAALESGVSTHLSAVPLLAANGAFAFYWLLDGVSGAYGRSIAEVTPMRKVINYGTWPLLAPGNLILGVQSAIDTLHAPTLAGGTITLGALLTGSAASRISFVAARAESNGGVGAPRLVPQLTLAASAGLALVGIGDVLTSLAADHKKKDDHKKKPVPDSSPTSTAPSVGPHLLSPTPSVSPTPTTTAATPTLAPRVHTNSAPSRNTGTGRLAAADSFSNVIPFNEPFDLSKLDANNRRFAAASENPENEPDFLAANSLIRIG